MSTRRRTSIDRLNSIITTAATGAVIALQAEAAYNAGEAGANEQNTTIESSQSIVALIRDVVIWTFKFILIGCCLVLSSCVSYIIIYCMVMPTVLVQKPLYFDYSCACSSYSRLGRVSMNDGSCLSDVKNNDNSQFNQMTASVCHPIAQVDFLEEHTQWLPLSSDVAPIRLGSRLLKPRSRYYIDISLTLPESDVNRNHGMFMVQADLFADNETKLATSFRSSMLPYQGTISGILRKCLLAVPLLIGAIPEARRIDLNAYDYFTESTDPSLALIGMSVKLLVNSRSQFPQSTQTIQVLSGEVSIGQELNMVQSYMKHWFYTCMIVGVFSIMVLQSMVSYIVYLRLYPRIIDHAGCENSEIWHDIGSELSTSELRQERDDDNNTNDYGLNNTVNNVGVSFEDDNNSDDWTTNIDDATDCDEPVNESDNDHDIQSNTDASPAKQSKVFSAQSTNNRRNHSKSDDSTQRLVENVMKGQFYKFTIFTGKFAFNLHQ